MINMKSLTYQEQLNIALKRVVENRKNKPKVVEQLPVIEKHDSYASRINDISKRFK